MAVGVDVRVAGDLVNRSRRVEADILSLNIPMKASREQKPTNLKRLAPVVRLCPLPDAGSRIGAA